MFLSVYNYLVLLHILLLILFYVHFFFFFNATSTTEIYTLSLHDALPIYEFPRAKLNVPIGTPRRGVYLKWLFFGPNCIDRKSTRLNSSHLGISYAVFCLKKKKKKMKNRHLSKNYYLSQEYIQY